MSQKWHNKGEIIDHLIRHGVKETQEVFGIPRRTLYRWRKERDKILNKEGIRNKVVKYKNENPEASIRKIKMILRLPISPATIQRTLTKDKTQSSSPKIVIEDFLTPIKDDFQRKGEEILAKLSTSPDGKNVFEHYRQEFIKRRGRRGRSWRDIWTDWRIFLEIEKGWKDWYGMGDKIAKIEPIPENKSKYFRKLADREDVTTNHICNTYYQMRKIHQICLDRLGIDLIKKSEGIKSSQIVFCLVGGLRPALRQKKPFWVKFQGKEINLSPYG